MLKNKSILILIVFFLGISNSFSQEKYTISGVIKDTKTNETLIAVNVYIPETNSSVSTNEYGFYSITIPKGNYTIITSYVGYVPFEKTVSLLENKKINISLSEDSKTLSEVVITENKKKTNTRSSF